MESTDQMLIGTLWTRSAGKHGPVTGTIDQTNDRGPRLKLDDGSHRRITWAELDFGWKPIDSQSTKRLNMWKDAKHIEYLDRKQAEVKEVFADLQTEINKEIPFLMDNDTGDTYGEIDMPTTEENGTAVEIEQTKECHGPWHRHGDSYEQVPLSQFSIITRGFNAGQLGSLCDSCRQKQRESDQRRKDLKAGISPVVERKKPGPKPGTIVRKKPAIELVDQLIPGVETPEGITYRWKITVTVSVDHYVQGKDFLEAAAQVAQLGEITKVEKL